METGLTFVVVVERLWRDCGCTSKFLESLFPAHSAVVCAWRKFTIHLKKQQNANGIRTVRTQLSWARGHTAYPYRDTVCAFATERWMPAASAAAVVTSQGLCCSRLYMVQGHRR